MAPVRAFTGLACLTFYLATVAAQPPSSAPNQQTLPHQPLLGVSAYNPEGFSDNTLPQNLTNQLILGPYYNFFLWVSRAADKFGELEPPIQVRITASISIAIWEATVPYSVKSLGLFTGGSLRRPLAEHTIHNMNKALSYSAYKMANFMMPYYQEYWQDTMHNLELPIDNNNVDPTDPVGIGNLAALACIEWFSKDGYNQLGDLTPDGGLVDGNPYNRWNYSDYTLFEPANGPYSITDPTKWQPLVIEPVPPYGGGGQGAVGAPYVQHHITPQIGHAKRLVYTGNLTAVNPIEPPTASLDPTSAAYKEQVDQVLAYSANLTDLYKIQAEHFDNKVRSLGSPFFSLILSNGYFHLDQIIFLFFAADLGLIDADSEVWGQKIFYNSARPITAIRYLYGAQNISAWGGPFRGTETLTGNEFRSYIKTMQHADYPSASSCFCATFTNAVRGVLGSDKFGVSFTYPAGSSGLEPGKTPAKDITLYWPTLTDYGDQCSWGRVLGGVHFRNATIAGEKLCAPIGKAAYLRAKALRDGVDTGPIDIATVV